MSTIVKKYGGTSVSNISKLKNIAQHILEDYQNDNNILVVLSAMGKTTDELITLANKSSKSPNPRDYDMLVSSGEQISASLLSIILNDIGVKAVAYTGWQAGIETDNEHSGARISCIHTKRIKTDLSKKIVARGVQTCVDCCPSHHHEVAARESAPSNGYLRVAVFFATFPRF